MSRDYSVNLRGNYYGRGLFQLVRSALCALKRGKLGTWIYSMTRSSMGSFYPDGHFPRWVMSGSVQAWPESRPELRWSCLGCSAKTSCSNKTLPSSKEEISKTFVQLCMEVNVLTLREFTETTPWWVNAVIKASWSDKILVLAYPCSATTEPLRLLIPERTWGSKPPSSNDVL